MANLPEKEAIIKACKAYRSQKGLSMSKLAVLCGCSSATISQLENGNLESIAEEMMRKIWNRVKSAAQAKQVFQTKAFRTCQSAMTAAKNNQLMIGIVADTGVGKTVALEAYARRQEVFLVTVEKAWTAKQFFENILREMGISFQGGLSALIDRIADELNVMKSPLLVIDEAGKIKHQIFIHLQSLRDKTEDSAGMVLAGMDYFKANLVKFSVKEKEGYAEFYRRVQLWQQLDYLSRKEIEDICAHHGITGKENVLEFLPCKRFGDLTNKLLLNSIQNNDNTDKN